MTRLLRRRAARRYPGLYRGVVVDATDPQGAGRLKVSVPSLSADPLAWALTLRDLGARPQVGEEVLVGFEAGALDAPYVVGVVATGATATPEMADDGGNSLRLTTSGIEINAAGEVRITTPSLRIVAGSMQVDAGTSEFSGVVRSPTVIADSIIAASYTPGAGNIL